MQYECHNTLIKPVTIENIYYNNYYALTKIQ